MTASGRRNPWRRSVSARERLPRERLELAAQPGRRGDREAALLAVHHLPRQQRLDRLAQQPLLREPAHLVLHRQREREVGDDRVHERHARLERPGHRRAVGLRQQVVDEVEAEVDVLKPRQQLVPLGLGEARRDRLQRIERAARPVSSARRRRRRSPSTRGGARAAEGAPRAQSASPCSRGSPSRRRRQPLDEWARGRCERPDSLRQQVGDVGVVAAEELVAPLAGERDLDVLGRELRERYVGSADESANGSSNASASAGRSSAASGRSVSSRWIVS